MRPSMVRSSRRLPVCRPPLTAPPSVPLREFTDLHGAAWRVWETRPTTQRLRAELRDGWLTFEADGARRRVAPIPENWEVLPEAALLDLCAHVSAEAPVLRRGTSW